MKITEGIKLGFNFFVSSFNKPSVLALETSSDCQADCIMCERDKLKREKQSMSMDTFRNAVLQAKKNKIKIIQLSFYGEPLLDPELVEKMAFLRETIPDAIVVFNTNGDGMTDEIIEGIIKYKIAIVRFSIEGNNKEEYESIRQNLSYDKLISSISKLKNARDKVNSNLQIVVWALNLESYPIDIKPFKEFWLRYADDVHIRHESKIILNSNENLFQKITPCFKPFGYFIVLANGDVTICDIDWYGEHVFGSINNSSMRKLWFSKKLIKLRLTHILGMKKTLNSCKDCKYKTFNSHFQNKYFHN